MTRSMSYSRYFRTATAMAVHRPTKATLCSTFRAAEVTQTEATNTTASASAAAAHHFSCNRSSPDDLTNLTTTATTLTSSAALIRTAATTKSVAVRPPGLAWPDKVNGCAHERVAAISMDIAASAQAPPVNHTAGRQRRERTCPVGKSRNKKASIATAITQIQLFSQADARPAGKDPGCVTSACSAYGLEKPVRPRPSPATRNSQPIRFSGRLDARTKPVTGTAMFTTCPETPETVQLVRLAGSRCRST